MTTTLGRFVLEPLGIYHPFTGVTNNQSESFNAALKRLQDWREVPIDSVILTLYHLQSYFHNEIQRRIIRKLITKQNEYESSQYIKTKRSISEEVCVCSE